LHCTPVPWASLSVAPGRSPPPPPGRAILRASHAAAPVLSSSAASPRAGIIEERPRSKLAKASKNKLKLSGYIEG
jgi:hypothetical protein